MKLIKNAKIITDSQVLEHNVILFDTKIHAILPEAQVNEADYEVIDANGAYLSPGFIDIHKHGAFNYDFMDADNQAAIAMLHACRKPALRPFIRRPCPCPLRIFARQWKPSVI